MKGAVRQVFRISILLASFKGGFSRFSFLRYFSLVDLSFVQVNRKWSSSSTFVVQHTWQCLNSLPVPLYLPVSTLNGRMPDFNLVTMLHWFLSRLAMSMVLGSSKLCTWCPVWTCSMRLVSKSFWPRSWVWAQLHRYLYDHANNPLCPGPRNSEPF